MGRRSTLVIEKDNEMISIKECAELLSTTIYKVSFYYYQKKAHTFNKIKELLDTSKRGWDFQNFYVLYSLDYPNLPVYYGNIKEIADYLGYKDTNSVNLIFTRLKKGERNGIARDTKTGISYEIAKFKTYDLEREDE